MAVPVDEDLRALLAKFTCVRIVQMWGVDLERFQFDFAMTWAAFFMHADGTIYGRYGSRSAVGEGSARDMSLAGFRASLAAALALHERYVADPAATRGELLGKATRRKPRWPRPEEIPALKSNARLAVPFAGHAEDRSGRAHGVGCIHCHMVSDSELRSLRAAGEAIPDELLWPYPMPDAIGLHMDPEQRATVLRVLDGSPAARAGLRRGDEILHFDGQPILSTADLQWVLHHHGSGDVAVGFARAGETRDAAIAFADGWRRKLGNWRFTNLGMCMQIAGFNGRPGRNGGERLAIVVGRVHQKRLLGVDLRKDDTIVALDGDRSPKNLGELTRWLCAKAPGTKVELRVRRRDVADEIAVTLELQ